MNMRLLILCLLLSTGLMAQPPLSNPGSNHGNRFEQLGYLLQSPNEYRTNVQIITLLLSWMKPIFV
jgi:hypothetical protein